MTKFLAACAALFFALVALIVGVQIASTWTSHHTDMVIGAGSAIGGLCVMALVVVPIALALSRWLARDRRETPSVEPASDYRTLIEQARYQQVMAQAMRAGSARLLAEREQGRLFADRQTRAVTPPGREPVEPARWEPSNGQWIDDVGDTWG